MARILRGEIYWADLEPTIGHEQSGYRPVRYRQRKTIGSTRVVKSFCGGIQGGGFLEKSPL